MEVLLIGWEPSYTKRHTQYLSSTLLVTLQQASNGKNFIMYDVSPPDWFSAQVPKQATPAADIAGKNIVTITSAQCTTQLATGSPGLPNNFSTMERPITRRQKQTTFLCYLPKH